MNYDCLIVDDEEALSKSTCEYFNLFGVSAFWVADADSCMRFFREHTVDLILLDINLGTSSGFELCKRLREITAVPILFISARQSDDDMLLALSIGGDDYIQKPYSLSVLLAKVKAVLGRYRAAASVSPSVPPVSVGGLTVDEDGRSVTLDGTRIELKLMEFKLLCYLMKNRGRVIGKEELFHKVWEDSIVGDNTLNVHIRRLREKLERDPNNPRYIRTVWGTGYVFEENPS
jgi:two-component system response regulator RegX3